MLGSIQTGTSVADNSHSRSSSLGVSLQPRSPSMHLNFHPGMATQRSSKDLKGQGMQSNAAKDVCHVPLCCAFLIAFA